MSELHHTPIRGTSPPTQTHTQRIFTVETCTVSFHDFWSLWTTDNVHKHCPRMQETTSTSPRDKPLAQDLLTADWTPLETEAPTSPEPGSPHTRCPLPLGPWKFSTATKASLLQTEPNLNPQAYPTHRRAWPPLSSFLCQMSCCWKRSPLF